MVQPDDRAAAPPRKTSVLAITSLILGVSSLCLCFLTGLPALICGGVSLVQIGSSKGRLGGMGFAIAGLLLGLVGTCGSTGVAGYFGYLSYDRAQDNIRATNNLKQIGIALHGYHDVNGRLPAASAPSGGGGFPFLGGPNANRPKVSWRVLLLPFIEQDNLYNRYRMDEAWDSPNNISLLDQMPAIYAAGKKRSNQNTTPFQVFVGSDTAFDPKSRVGFADITDGTSNTIFVAEATTEVPWTKPDDLQFTPNGPLPKLGRADRNTFLALMGDGSVVIVPKAINDQTLRNAINRHDGNVLGPDWPR